MAKRSMEDRSTDLMAISQGIKDDIMSTLHSAMPGIIKSFNPDLQTAVVQTAIRRRVKREDGLKHEADPVLADVPVLFLGGGNSRLTFPVQAGDECLVLFADHCIDAWYQSGGVQNQLMPRMHDISDGFALVGFRSKPNRIRNFNSEYPNIEGDLHINNLPLAEWVNQFHHGNHVPEVEAPNPAIYLRNDNTWQEIKPDHIGAADEVHAHGNITDGGKIGTAPDKTLMTGADGLVVAKTMEEAIKIWKFTNPNLLHNWDFRNPVNQRGVWGLGTNGLYGHDRWISYEGSTYFNTYSMVLSAGGAIEQRLEGVLLAGKTVTVSILTSEYGIEFASGVFPSSTGTVVLTINHLTITLGHGGTYMFIRVKTSFIRYIEAVKIELGTVSTLAYDAPMDWAVELPKCQRFYENSWFPSPKETSRNQMIAYIYSPTDGECYINFNTRKRIQTTFVLPKDAAYAWSTGWIRFYNGFPHEVTPYYTLRRGGVLGEIVRLTKAADDPETWVSGQMFSVHGHWEALADL